MINFWWSLMKIFDENFWWNFLIKILINNFGEKIWWKFLTFWLNVCFAKLSPSQIIIPVDPPTVFTLHVSHQNFHSTTVYLSSIFNSTILSLAQLSPSMFFFGVGGGWGGFLYVEFMKCMFKFVQRVFKIEEALVAKLSLARKWFSGLSKGRITHSSSTP